jgi:LacI family transcriptional regulator
MKRVTLSDIAREAGVSAATVSLVLNDRPARITDGTRDRVRSIAASLGYRPNALAQSLRRQQTHAIGLISDQIGTTPFAVGIVAAVEAVARAHGQLVFLVDTQDDPETATEAIAALRQHQVTHFVYACMYHRVVELPPDLGPHVVLCNARVIDDTVPAVVPDERRGAYDATTQLLETGHRHVAFLNDVLDPPAAALRLAGYHDALEDAGVGADPRWVHTADPSFEGGREATHRLLDAAPDVTGIFAFNDRMAVGCLAAAHDRGLAVPHDLSLVGFDGTDVAACALPPLTTVALPHREMGRWAATALLDTPEPLAPMRGETRLLQCDVVRGASVGPPPIAHRSRMP